MEGWLDDPEYDRRSPAWLLLSSERFSKHLNEDMKKKRRKECFCINAKNAILVVLQMMMMNNNCKCVPLLRSRAGRRRSCCPIWYLPNASHAFIPSISTYSQTISQRSKQNIQHKKSTERRKENPSASLMQT